MTDEPTDGEHGIDRRAVLGSLAAGAAGVGGLASVAAGATSSEFDGAVRARGELTPAEAEELLRQVEEFDGVGDADADCYTDTKCSGTACGTQGAVAYRTCCPNLGGCGSWNYSGICC